MSFTFEKRNLKYHILTFGCQMNHSDSERLAGVLESCGMTQTHDIHEADFVFINACSVRQSAIDRIWGKLRHFDRENQSRTQSKKLYTALTGCVLPADRPKFAAVFDLYFPMKDLKDLPVMISRLLHEKHVINTEQKKRNRQRAEKQSLKMAASPLSREDILSEKQLSYNNPQMPITGNSQMPAKAVEHYLQLAPKYTFSFAASVPIMTGCNAFCTYCAVPFTRGREVSRKAEEILSEIDELLDRGCKEITLHGQIINKWMVPRNNALVEYIGPLLGKHGSSINAVPELQDAAFQKQKLFKFYHLLAVINELKGDFWLRYTSSHPKWFSSDLIATIARCQKIPHHVHLPVQSGSNTVLRRMLRPYSREEYLDTIQRIRQVLPEASITTDCIVGFSGETECEFKDTCGLFEDIQYDMAFIAEYSVRPGTKAAQTLADDVTHECKEMRRKQLTDILRNSALSKNLRLIGSVVRVLVTSEKKDSKYQKEKIYAGRTANFKHIHFTAPAGVAESLVGQFVNVKIADAHPWSLSGNLA